MPQFFFCFYAYHTHRTHNVFFDCFLTHTEFKSHSYTRLHSHTISFHFVSIQFTIRCCPCSDIYLCWLGGYIFIYCCCVYILVCCLDFFFKFRWFDSGWEKEIEKERESVYKRVLFGLAGRDFILKKPIYFRLVVATACRRADRWEKHKTTSSSSSSQTILSKRARIYRWCNVNFCCRLLSMTLLHVLDFEFFFFYLLLNSHLFSKSKEIVRILNTQNWNNKFLNIIIIRKWHSNFKLLMN